MDDMALYEFVLLSVLGCVCLSVVECRQIFFLMIRRPPRSTLDRSSAASDVYKRQLLSYDESLDGVESALRAMMERRALKVVIRPA